jgi:hypothetical protein
VKDLDVTNPWEAHAYFALVFRCEDCHIYFSIASAHPECSTSGALGLPAARLTPDGLFHYLRGTPWM